MNRWFRHYAGLCTDPKFGGIARRAGVTRDRVVFVFCFLLESAAEANAGGACEWDAEALADILHCEPDEMERVMAQFLASGLVTDSNGVVTLASWGRRQHESDRDPTNAERQRRFRERNKAKNKTNQIHNHVTTVTDSNGVTNGNITPPIDIDRVKENSPKNQKTREAYTADFAEFWKAYPTSPNMSKKDAFAKWRKLTPQDRIDATASLPAFKSWIAKQKFDYTPVYADRYLSQRRFEGHLQAVQPAAIEQPPDGDHARRLLGLFCRTGNWPFTDFSDEPGSPRCRIPIDVLAEFRDRLPARVRDRLWPDDAKGRDSPGAQRNLLNERQSERMQ